MNKHVTLIALRQIGITFRSAPLAIALLLNAAPARAALTDLATAPLANATTAIVKPNVMFTLDASGSMGNDFMPDYVSAGAGTAGEPLCKSSGSSLQVCTNGDPAFNSALVNGIYYNPAVTYVPAVNYDGTVRTSYGSPWTAVPVDAYGIQSTSNTNLVTGFPDIVYCNTSSPTAADRTPPFDNVSAKPCRLQVQGGVWTYPNTTYSRRFAVNSPLGPYYYTIGSIAWCNTAAAGTGFGTGTCQAKKTATFKFPQYGTIARTEIVPATTTYPRAASRTDCAAATTCTYAEEMTNFANWYAYYRTRMQMMKTASGRAFTTVDDKFRVGFITIDPGSPVNASYFLPVRDFTAGAGGQKDQWYTKFYQQNPLTSTPLRTALARVGRYFAGRQDGINNGITDDPMQYYCQPNFTILSTDGLWNDTSNPVQLNGSTAIGDQDSNPAVTPRPLLDSTGSSVTNSTLTTTLQQQVCTGNNNTTFSTSGGGANTACGCTGNQKKIIQRQLDSTATSVSVNGGTPTTGTVVTNSFIDIVPCGAATVTATTTPVTVQQALVCQGAAGSATFASGNTETCSCGGSVGSSRKELIRERFTGATRTVITQDGVVTSDTVSGGARTVDYSINGTTWVTTSYSGSSCTSNSLSNSAVSYSGGTTTSSTTGSTVTAAQITLTPTNPKSTTFAPTTTTANVGAPNTLADVAQYYYATDLRPNGSLGAPVGSPATQLDVGTGDPNQPATAIQRMTTFTIGLGVNGTLTYTPDYNTNPQSDFLAITNGTMNWPVPSANAPETIDDLWHAAVNGRGKYFSAQNPTAVTQGVASALQGVTAVVGSAAAAATSNLEPVAGDNFAYIASYETVRWNGQLQARAIDLNTGVIGTTDVWSAQGQLDLLPFGSRVIKRFRTSATNKLEDFNYGNLNATEQAWFNAPYISSGANGLSQWSTLSPANQTAAQGANLVNFVRGDTSLEATVYRDRFHVLGDIVNAQPVFAKKAPFTYTDPQYATFANCVNFNDASSCTGVYSGTRPRQPTVYIASNDGMLHALNGDTGAERWAFVPNIVMPKLFKLADTDYANRHQYTVDGTPTIGDVFDPGTSRWRTILVGGLNGGGRGYYALDVTDPLNPIGLWEFSVRATASCPSGVILGVSTDDCDLGFTYGNPVISKLGDGSWVVMVTSGYNNVSPGDGKGYLYVLDPITGVIKKKIQAANATQGLNPGSVTTPAGLGKIANWVADSSTSNTTLRVYGGDLQGNVWRFNTDTATAYAIAQLKDPSNVAQPITTKLELGQIGNGASAVDMVFIGTGEYLGATDLPSTQVQTIYAIKDATSGVAPATPINARGGSVVAQTLTSAVDALGNSVRTVTSNTVDVTASTTNGWRIDLPIAGERVSIDPKLQLGTLIIGSNVPANTVCEPGGFAFLNFVDYKTGSYLPGATTAGQRVPGSLLVGVNVVRLPDGRTVVIATTSDNQHPTLNPPFSTPNATGRRSGWRELSQ